MKRYFKREAESALGVGVAYLAFDGEWATRQVENYGDRWFRSDRDFHAELGSALCDQPLAELGLTAENEVEQFEFEQAWLAPPTDMKRFSFLAVLLLWPLLASAQLAVTVAPVKATGRKAIVPLAMKNGFAERIESARALRFLLNDQGKMVGQASRWIIGGTPGTRPGWRRERPTLSTS